MAGELAAKNATAAQLKAREQILKRVDVLEEQESEILKNHIQHILRKLGDKVLQ